MTRRGAFIVIEGLDRSGKTTQTELLAEHLATTTGGGGLLSVSRRKFPGKNERVESTDISHPSHTFLFQIVRRAQAS
jgi:thymidylate kinase